jgi:hypothetical protein
MSIWPWRLSAAGLVSLFACIGAFVVLVIFANGAIALSTRAGVDAAAIPLIALATLATPAYCATFPLALTGASGSRRETQALSLGIACVCSAAFLLTI